MSAVIADDFAAIAATTQAVYERHAAGFDRHRPKGLHEKPWLDRFSALLPPGGRILDLGCGAGDPIARHFLADGFDVTGVDFSAPMLALARVRLPQSRWLQADMRELELGETFDGIIGWNSFFHLSAADQRSTLPRLAAHLAPNGALMLTVGPRAGEVIGQVEGEPIYHASLSPQEYEALLGELGLAIIEFVFEDPTCDQQTVLLAQRRETPER